MNIAQHKLNKEYNRYMLKLVEWIYLYNKVSDEIEQGFKPIKTVSKLEDLERYILESINSIEHLSKQAKHYSDLIDDKSLIALFKAKMKEREQD